MWPHLRNFRPKWFSRSSAWSDLHGMPMNVLIESPIGLCYEGKEILKKYKKLSDFGADSCQWIPYWKSSDYLTTSSDDLLTSVYKRDDGAMICIIVNNSNKSNSGWVDFEKLGLKTNAVFSELMTGRKIQSNGTKVFVEIQAYEGNWIKIQ